MPFAPNVCHKISQLFSCLLDFRHQNLTPSSLHTLKSSRWCHGYLPHWPEKVSTPVGESRWGGGKQWDLSQFSPKISSSLIHSFLTCISPLQIVPLVYSLIDMVLGIFPLSLGSFIFLFQSQLTDEFHSHFLLLINKYALSRNQLEYLVLHQKHILINSINSFKFCKCVIKCLQNKAAVFSHTLKALSREKQCSHAHKSMSFLENNDQEYYTEGPAFFITHCAPCTLLHEYVSALFYLIWMHMKPFIPPNTHCIIIFRSSK